MRAIPYEISDEPEASGRIIVARHGLIAPRIKPTTFLRQGFCEYRDRMEMLRLANQEPIRVFDIK